MKHCHCNALLPERGRLAHYLRLQKMTVDDLEQLTGSDLDQFFNRYMDWARAEADQRVSRMNRTNDLTTEFF